MMSSDSADETPFVFVCADGLHGIADSDDFVIAERIMPAVLSIQEQASQVEAAIALSELESARADHDCLKLLLENKELELNALRKQVKQGKEKVSCLLLEKELAQGEAAKYKEHLRMCIQVMVESSGGENNEEDTTCGNHWPVRRDLRSRLSHRSRRASMQDGLHQRTSVINQNVVRGKTGLTHHSENGVADFRKLRNVPVVRGTLSRRSQVHKTSDADDNSMQTHVRHARKDSSIAQLRPATSPLKHRRR
ncbi:hypothetical protein MHU86_24655 [Fragilaria crotonensis]|nr:hypothetical protein MHU86_24655 [Fragilaria crotonensis]